MFEPDRRRYTPLRYRPTPGSENRKAAFCSALPRIATVTDALLATLVSIVIDGTEVSRSAIELICRRSRSSAPRALTAIGVVWRFSVRRSAVTITSSSCASASCASATPVCSTAATVPSRAMDWCFKQGILDGDPEAGAYWVRSLAASF
jgi:hypothetical protein